MQDLVAGFPFLLKLNAWIFSSRGSDLIYRELLQQFFPTSSLLRFRGVGTKPLYEFLQFLTFIFYLFILIQLLLQGKLAGFVPETIVACMDLDFSKVYIGNMGTYAVQEMPIVRNDNYRVFKVR